MDRSKRKRLESAGWRVGSVEDFLSLSRADAEFIELKLRLARAFAAQRSRERLTQTQAARLLGSSQSRIAKMEAGDPSVSADLLIRSLLVLGASRRELATVLAQPGRAAPRPRASNMAPARQHKPRLQRPTGT